MSVEFSGVANAPWFALASGVASMLGCLLAFYPVQVRGIQPSVYRSLIWQKTLLLAVGLGVIVTSSVQIYNRPYLDPAAVLHQMIESKPSSRTSDNSVPDSSDSVSGGALNADPGGLANVHEESVRVGAGVLAHRSTAEVQSPGAGVVEIQQSGTAKTEIQPDSGGGNETAVHAAPTIPGATPMPGTTTAFSRKDKFWVLTMMLGTLAIVVGVGIRPFESVMYKLERLDDRLENNRATFLQRISDLPEVQATFWTNEFDRNSELTRAALFYMLTGYRLIKSSERGGSLSTRDLRAMAAFMKFGEYRQEREKE